MRRYLRVLIVAVSSFALLLGNPANLAAVEFSAPKSYPVGTNPVAIAIGDFNGDGKPDLAVANQGSSNVSILLGNGDGTFKAAVNYATGNSPSAIAVGDFNGDGKLDLAVFQAATSQSSTSSVSILFGNGDGTFQTFKQTAFNEFATAMAVADFNLDKKSDLAVTVQDFTSGLVEVEVFLSNGDGTFQSAGQTRTPNADRIIALAAGDFNGDSKPDLAVTTSNSGIQILLGRGDGIFSQGATVGSGRPASVLAVDLNHDGKTDLLANFLPPLCFERCRGNRTTTLVVFLGNGDGTFQAEPVFAGGADNPFVGDFNGDGKLDVAYVSGDSLKIQLGKGDGTFSPVVFSIPGSFVAAQDFNADKLSDLVALGTSNDISVLLNTSPTSGADMSIVSSGPSGATVGVGENLTFTADVLNQGPKDATGVIFTDTLPNNVNFVSANALQGTCVQSHGIVSCNIGSLASAFDSTVSIVVTPTVTGTITNSMNVTANETDPVPANNTASQTNTVVPVFTLTVSKTGNGSGTIYSNDSAINCGATCSAPYLSGTVVRLAESPVAANSLFAGWSGACTGTGACSITMDANKSVTANFVLGMTLNVSLAGSGNGNVTSNDGMINCGNLTGNVNSDCSSLYLPGTSVSLTAAVGGTSVFGGWIGACSGTDPKICSITLNSNQSVTATVNPPPDFTLTRATATLTAQKGAQVTDVLTLTGQNGFSGAATLSCAVTGPAPMATCNVAPSPVTLGSSAVTATLTITAPATLAALALPLNGGNRGPLYAAILPIPTLMFALVGLFSRKFANRRRRSWLLGGSVMILFAVLAGCGSGSAPPPQPQNYSVTVTATSGSLQHSTTVMLTVQ